MSCYFYIIKFPNGRYLAFVGEHRDQKVMTKDINKAQIYGTYQVAKDCLSFMKKNYPVMKDCIIVDKAEEMKIRSVVK